MPIMLLKMILPRRTNIASIAIVSTLLVFAGHQTLVELAALEDAGGAEAKAAVSMLTL